MAKCTGGGGQCTGGEASYKRDEVMHHIEGRSHDAGMTLWRGGSSGCSNKFRDWCNEAGLKHCSAHGLRKAAATPLAEAGASAHQLMAWFGWKSLKEAERYTRAVDQKKLAASVVNLLGRAKDGT
ncbi:MAG: tyrosine-type recombinase/integrase [Hyphomicrobiaceae bacterium]|nr:tyrosine-type recombinase/integrase [Hyphomicrobiaceae bacterium]